MTAKTIPFQPRNQQITVRELVRKDAEYVWLRRRDYDRRECEVQGAVDRSHVEHLLAATECYSIFRADEPVAMFGCQYHPEQASVWAWFLATDQVEYTWKSVHELAKRYFPFWQRKYGVKVYVQVWEGHIPSRDWLKQLGFQEWPDRFPAPGGEQNIIMELI